MTGKERLIYSINYKQPDKIPVDFGSTAVTVIHVHIIGIYYSWR